jgi:hypothetical protein
MAKVADDHPADDWEPWRSCPICTCCLACGLRISAMEACSPAPASVWSKRAVPPTSQPIAASVLRLAALEPQCSALKSLLNLLELAGPGRCVRDAGLVFICHSMQA